MPNKQGLKFLAVALLWGSFPFVSHTANLWHPLKNGCLRSYLQVRGSWQGGIFRVSSSGCKSGPTPSGLTGWQCGLERRGHPGIAAWQMHPIDWTNCNQSFWRRDWSLEAKRDKLSSGAGGLRSPCGCLGMYLLRFSVLSVISSFLIHLRFRPPPPSHTHLSDSQDLSRSRGAFKGLSAQCVGIGVGHNARSGCVANCNHQGTLANRF